MGYESADSTGRPPMVRLPAAIDLSNGEAIDSALRQLIRISTVVEIDCAGLNFIDASGARSLVSAYHVASDAGCVLRLVDLRGGPRRVLSVLGVIDLFENHQRPA